jgi:hypothetical protein
VCVCVCVCGCVRVFAHDCVLLQIGLWQFATDQFDVDDDVKCGYVIMREGSSHTFTDIKRRHCAVVRARDAR